MSTVRLSREVKPKRWPHWSLTYVLVAVVLAIHAFRWNRQPVAVKKAAMDVLTRDDQGRLCLFDNEHADACEVTEEQIRAKPGFGPWRTRGE